MSLTHLVERLAVKREVPQIGFIDDDLSVITYQNTKRTIESQIGIESKPLLVEVKFSRYRERYLRHREKHIATNKRCRAAKREEYNKKRKETYHKKMQDPIEREKHRQRIANQRAKNPDTYKAIQKRYRDKKFAQMTQEQAKEYRRMHRQKYVAKMIEKLGIDGWRKFDNDRKKSYKQKKEKNSVKCI